MAIAHVQGTSNYGASGPGLSVTLSGVGAGNCLVLSATLHEFSTLGKGAPLVSDSLGNQWQLVCQSPIVTASSGPQDWSMYVWVALNCAAGNTTVSFASPTDDSPNSALLLDEYSDVATAQAVDSAITFASTSFQSGVTVVASGSITTTAGEMLYSSVFSGSVSDNTYTPTSGFTPRQSASGGSGGGAATAASFDQLSTGGSYSNTVTVATGTTPDTLQVCLLALSPTAISRPFVQSAFYENCSIAGTVLTSATFPLPNTQGNLLVLAGYMSERSSPVVTDTQGNAWVVVYNGTQNPAGNFVMAYALSCNAGANTVTLNTLDGGDDVTLSIIISEYEGVSGFLSSSFGASSPNTTVDTGDITIGSPDSLLVSYFLGNTITGTNPYAYGPAANLGTRRFQISSSGFINQAAFSMAIADQVESVAGSYDNVFTVNRSGPLEAAILGFKLSLALSCASGVGFVGVLYTSALVATGGRSPYTFSIASGGLPPGLVLDSTTGIISGIPTTTGIYPYTAEVVDSLDNRASASLCHFDCRPNPYNLWKAPYS